MMIIYSFRYFDTTIFQPKEFPLSLDSIPVPRETGRLPSTGAYLSERRISSALFGEYRKRSPSFTMASILEEKLLLRGPKGPLMGGYFASMHLFITILFLDIDWSCEAWERVLAKLDIELNITVCTPLALGAFCDCYNTTLKII
jgi:hypothetical protein